MELGPGAQQALGTRRARNPPGGPEGDCWGAHAPHPSILLRFSEEEPRTACGLAEGAGVGGRERGSGRRGVAAGRALRRPAPSARGAPGDAAGPHSLGRRGRSGGLAHPLILILHARRWAARSRAPAPVPSVAGRGRREAGPRAWESQEAGPQDMGFGCTDGGLRGSCAAELPSLLGFHCISKHLFHSGQDSESRRPHHLEQRSNCHWLQVSR